MAKFVKKNLKLQYAPLIFFDEEGNRIFDIMQIIKTSKQVKLGKRCPTKVIQCQTDIDFVKESHVVKVRKGVVKPATERPKIQIDTK